MFDQCQIFRVILLLIWIIQDRAVKSQLSCILSAVPNDQRKKLTLCSQPSANRFVESFSSLLQSLDSLVMLVALRELFVSSHWCITHKPLNRIDRSKLGSLKERWRLLLDDSLMVTRSLCPISSLLSSYAKSLIISRLGLEFNSRFGDEFV